MNSAGWFRSKQLTRTRGRREIGYAGAWDRNRARLRLRLLVAGLCCGVALLTFDLANTVLAQRARLVNQTPTQQSKITPSPSPTPSPAEQEIDPDDVISVQTTEILLPVTVRDGNGELVSGLTRNEFAF